MYNTSIFIFRRDLRLVDNIGLMKALKESKTVIPIFIFTPTQLTKKNKYKSDNCVQFMMESLDELDKALRKKNSRLFYFYNEPHIILDKLIKKLKVNAVYFNNDYTLYSHKRDKKIINVCKKNKTMIHISEDILLIPVGKVRSTTDNIYTKFTPYFNKAKKELILKPQLNKYSNYYKKYNEIQGEYKGTKTKFYTPNPNINTRGGRSISLKILKSINKFKKYNSLRDTPSINTTHLSSYIKFGCVSIREVYHMFKKHLGTRNELIKQLYWRDFYHNISHYYPHIYTNYGSLKSKYDNIKWDNNTSYFTKWKKGETGYPIVDAAMRQLNTIGFMHNRCRMIVASFLIKTLLINWKKGEKYFAQQLVDYDPANNSGGWQWASGSGADSQPYFRMFNPWLQSLKHDKDCIYIKKWIPELQSVPNKHIHHWYKYHKTYKGIYIKPIVDYKKQKKKALGMYKKIF